ncbi:MAG: DUF4374 domain-containing protein [Prevotellaceae bacterium]|jgi:hypothetical protein|nr:DUF4374 domain-containing protein [Prevotellaceae bacterium]
MRTSTNIKNLLSAALVLGFVSSCSSDDKNDTSDSSYGPYAVSLGITVGAETTYYIVSADDLMAGDINAQGKGIEQNGYYDYEQGNQTIFCVGGLGLTDVKGITRDASGALQQKGDFVLDQSPKLFTQITPQEMLAVELPDNENSGDSITFYAVDISSLAITRKVRTSIRPFALLDWPSVTGLSFSENKVYMTYFPMNQTTWETGYTDTAYVAVFAYPDMTPEIIMKDTRTGPAGSWNAYNGIFQTESGDMYIMSNSAIANGFSQSTKGAAFLRIPKGTTNFDDYYFDFEAASGGLRPAHVKYLGSGLVFAEVSTLTTQTAEDRWLDNSLKSCIIDLNSKTVSDVSGIPVHNGNGGRRFAVLADDGYVYNPVATEEGTYIYRIDPRTATATRGAKVSATFVAGLFKLD